MMKEFRASMAGMISQSTIQANGFCVSMKKGQVDADHELMEVINENKALVENNVAALENASSKAADMTVVSLEVRHLFLASLFLCIIHYNYYSFKSGYRKIVPRYTRQHVGAHQICSREENIA